MRKFSDRCKENAAENETTIFVHPLCLLKKVVFILAGLNLSQFLPFVEMDTLLLKARHFVNSNLLRSSEIEALPSYLNCLASLLLLLG